MRSVSIRDLRANLSKELGNLPFRVTRNGVLVGVVCTQECKCTQSDSKSVHNLERNQLIQSDWRDSINAMPKKGK